MKKRNWLLICVSLFLLLGILSGCNDSSAGTETTSSVSDGEVSYAAHVDAIKLNFLSEAAISTSFTCFKDNTYKYYLFDLGTMTDVAIDSGKKYRYDGVSTKTITFETTNFSLTSSEQIILTTTKQNTENNELLTIPEFSIGYVNVGSAYQKYSYTAFEYLEEYSEKIKESAGSYSSIKQEETFAAETRYPGNYLYVTLADVEVYASVTLDYDGKVVDVRYLSSVKSANPDFVYLGESDTYANESKEEKFSFNVNDSYVQTVIKNNEPTLNIEDKYNFSPELQYCGKDKNYVAQEEDETAKLINPYLVEFELTCGGYNEKNNKYIHSEDEHIIIKLKADKNAILTQNENNTAALCEDSSKSVYALGSTRETAGVGYGALILRVTPKGESAPKSPVISVNVLSTINNGEFINLKDLGLSSEELANADKIEIAFVYEIEIKEYETILGKKILNPFGTKYTNWKYEFSFDFE